MAYAIEPICVLVLLLFQLFSPLMELVATREPTPAAWPHQFHSMLFINRSGSLHKVNLWYDWLNGRNFNIIQHQLGELKYDLEWNNATPIHYQRNVGNGNVAIVVLSSHNPRIITIANVMFGSMPPTASDVLVKAFQLDKATVNYMQSKF